MQTSSRQNSNIQTRSWDVERQSRLARGLCFRCNEKYSPGHRCKTGSLSILEATHEEEEGTPEYEQVEESSDQSSAFMQS